MSRYAIHAAVALSVLSTGAQAANWTLTFSGSLFNAYISPGAPETTSLVLNITTEDTLSTSTTQYNLGLGYRVTGFTGTRDGQAVTAVLSSSDPFFSSGLDNYIYPGDPQLVSELGLGYRTADGTLYNLYGFTANFVNPPEVQQWEQTSLPTAASFPPYITYQGSISLQPAAAVPEPGSLALLLAGGALVSGALRRRARG